MLTTSAYTEPAFVNPFLNEPMQLQTHIYEADDFESGSFEKILAGFQQHDEETKNQSRIEDTNRETAVKDDSDNEAPEKEAYLAAVNTEAENFIENLADVKTKTDSIFFHDAEKVRENTAELTVTENLQQEEIPAEHLLVLQTAENKIAKPEENAVKDFSFNEAHSELAAAVSAENNIDGIQESKAAFANNVFKDADKKSASVSETASAQVPEENLQANAAEKNDAAKEQIIAAANKDNIEKTVSHDTRGEKLASFGQERPVNTEVSAIADRQKRDTDHQINRVDDTRTRGRRDRLTVEVHNQRTAASAEQVSFSQTMHDTPVKEITLELHLPHQSQNSSQSSAQTVWEARSSSVLENMLARELHQNFNGDIVRHASMVLRDGGEGTIKLALKPETLGNVKIHLEMSENKITGRIIVESEEALNAFKREIASLEQAFRESGFSDANLNLSLGMENGNMADKDETSFMPNMIALRYDDSSVMQGIEAAASNIYIGNKPSTINLLA